LQLLKRLRVIDVPPSEVVEDVENPLVDFVTAAQDTAAYAVDAHRDAIATSVSYVQWGPVWWSQHKLEKVESSANGSPRCYFIEVLCFRSAVCVCVEILLGERSCLP
jgi:hypothetical protein